MGILGRLDHFRALQNKYHDQTCSIVTPTGGVTSDGAGGWVPAIATVTGVGCRVKGLGDTAAEREIAARLVGKELRKILLDWGTNLTLTSEITVDQTGAKYQVGAILDDQGLATDVQVVGIRIR